MNDSDIQKDKQYLTANVSILIAFLFIFQVEDVGLLIRWALLLSFCLFVVSLLLMFWHVSRYPKRASLYETLKEKTAKKYSEQMALFVEELILPLTRSKARDGVRNEISKAKTAEERKEILDRITKELEEPSQKLPERFYSVNEDKAIKFVIEGFSGQLVSATKEDHRIAFNQPLKEQHAKMKYYCDQLAMRVRRHIFISAAIFCLAAIFIRLLGV